MRSSSGCFTGNRRRVRGPGWHALLSALRGPGTRTRDPVRLDVGDVPGRWVVHRREADIGTKIGAGEPLEEFGRTFLGDAGPASVSGCPATASMSWHAIEDLGCGRAGSAVQRGCRCM